ncbi:MAG: transcriptional regulator, TetR family [Verrucomicrobia bacterium]|nr:transcriptional regulator, TetR family [Verrucomicrobiota bacterium]
MVASADNSTAAAGAADHSPNARILAAAQRHFFAYGYNAVTMDDLAHELGMSKKTLYRHFPGKDAILATIIEGIGRQIRLELDAVLDNPRISFSQKLRAMIGVIVPRLALMSPTLLRELQRYAPRIFQRIDELRQRNIPYVFGRLFREGIADGSVHPALDPDFAAQFWLQAIRGLSHPDVLATTRLTPAHTLEKALDLFAGGLLTRAGRKDYEKLFAH